jgi:hypothetical protein
LLSEKVHEAIIKGFSDGVNKALEDGIFTEEEEDALKAYKNQFSLSKEELDSHDQSFTKIDKAIAIRQVLNGQIPDIYKQVVETPIILQKNEVIVWAFNDVNFMEVRTRTHYEGTTQGVSIRIAKGLYYRTGAFRGNPVQTTSLVKLDEGTLLVTNRNLYFSGSVKKLRIRYQDVMEFTPYDDGIGVTKNTASAKLQIFQMVDGWFINNLVANLAKLQTSQ